MNTLITARTPEGKGRWVKLTPSEIGERPMVRLTIHDRTNAERVRADIDLTPDEAEMLAAQLLVTLGDVR